jgi:hypothetical protein
VSLYGDDLAELAHSLAELLARGADAQAAAPVDPARVLLARDTVLSATRTAFDAVTPAETTRLATDPWPTAAPQVRELRAALHDLPRASPDLAPSEVTALTVDAKQDRLWRAAAIASLGLTTHEPGLRRLTGPAAWTATQDLVAVAAALNQLDHDLTRGLVARGEAGRAYGALGDPLRHGALQRAVHGVVGSTARQPPDRAGDRLRSPVPPRPLVIRTAADLPDAARRITAMLQDRGGRVALRDITIVAATLAHGATYAADLLHDAGRANGHPELSAAAQALLDLRPAMAALTAQRAAAATLSSPSPALAAQCAEMVGALRVLGERTHSYAPTPPGKSDEATLAVLTWADELPSVSREIQTSLAAAAASRAICTPRDPDLRAPAAPLWRPVRPQDRPPILRSAAVLRSVAGQLSAPIRQATVALGQRDPREAASPHAVKAVAQLRRVLGRREDARVDTPFPGSHPETVRHSRRGR